MKVKTLEYNTMRFLKMSVLHVLVYMKMMLIQLNGLNVRMRIVKYGVTQSVWRCVKMPMCV